MLYYLFDFLDQQFDIPGLGLFQYTSFRAGMAVLMALMIALFFGKRIINYLRREQLGETVRDLGLEGQVEKAGTPTMGGIIIILARSEEHTSELQSRGHLVCRLLLEKK